MVRFGDEREHAERFLHRQEPSAAIVEHRDPAGASTALDHYFTGDLAALDRLQVEFYGTDFQRRVWTALRAIGAGRTASYLDIASSIGAPSAVRAVGAANGANPIPIVVPCHRIIGTSGALVGYGGGLDRKRWLLEHEGCSSRYRHPRDVPSRLRRHLGHSSWFRACNEVCGAGGT